MPPTVTGDRLWPAGTLRVAAGTCPGCAGASHPGRSCDGLTHAQVVEILGKLPTAVYVPLSDRDDRR